MPRVICERPNASDNINGINFSLREDGSRISDEIDEQTAQAFLEVPGYYTEDAAPVAPAPKAKAKKAAAQPASDSAPEADPAPVADQGSVF